MSDLAQEHCRPCPPGTPPLNEGEAKDLLTRVQGWAAEADYQVIHRTFEFKNFYQTMAFANAVAWIANREDHHPDLELSYKRCRVHYSTHSVGGLSRNDFICAKKIDALLDQ